MLYIQVYACMYVATYVCTYVCDNQLGSLSTEVAVAITCIITVILTLTIATVITYICVKRRFKKILHKNDQQNETVLYEQVGPSNNPITNNDLKLQPNPAYGTSQKVNMDTNPAYESCK